MTLNPVLEAIQGKVGDLIFKRWSDNEIVTRMPDRTGIVPSANQMAPMNKFRLAALYGKSVMAAPDQREVYADAAARKGVLGANPGFQSRSCFYFRLTGCTGF